jgi:hypothetical protein
MARSRLAVKARNNGGEKPFSSKENAMTPEMLYGIGALVVLAALAVGTTLWASRNGRD